MGDQVFDYNTRIRLGQELGRQLSSRIGKLAGQDKQLALEIKKGAPYYYGGDTPLMTRVIDSYHEDEEKKPSQWFGKDEGLLGRVFDRKRHQGLLDAFVPKELQPSYLYIIDKLNQFPYTRGWNRRAIRTRGYGPQMSTAFALLTAYSKLFYCGTDLEAVIMGRLPEEVLDYMKHGDNQFRQYFSYIYAAEIDLGNQKVISALKGLILSENNTAYLDREMILGILRSDNGELHSLLCDLLLAARLQEGLRQAICEAMDEGGVIPFMLLLKTIEENNLIRFASVKRAVSTWIGIFDENSADRVNGKMLELMGLCLRDEDFMIAQVKSNDSIAISVGLWAAGFVEIRRALGLMEWLIENGTKNQKMTASFYNQLLQVDRYKQITAKKALLKYSQDLELAACFMPAFNSAISGQMSRLFQAQESRGIYGSGTQVRIPKAPVLTDFFEDREEALALYGCFLDLLERLPKKGVKFSPCIFPWYQVELKPGTLIMELAVIACVLGDEEKITRVAGLLGEIPPGFGLRGRSGFVNLLLYNPSNREQRRILVDYVGNGEACTSAMARELVRKRMTLEREEYLQLEDMLRYKRSGLRKDIIEILMEQKDDGLEETLKRLVEDGREEKRTAALDIMLQISKMKDREALSARVLGLPQRIENPTDREQILIGELTAGTGLLPVDAGDTGYGLYSPTAHLEPRRIEPDSRILKRCLPLPEKGVVEIIKKLDDLVDRYKDYEYLTDQGEAMLLGNVFRPLKGCAQRRYRLDDYPLAEELRRFYEKEIGSYEVFVELEALLRTEGSAYRWGEACYRAVWGKLPFSPLPLGLKYPSQINEIRLCYRQDYLDRKALFEESLHVLSALADVINRKMTAVSYEYQGWNGRPYSATCFISQLPLLDRYFQGIAYWDTEEEFEKAFHTAYRFQMKCLSDQENRRFFHENGEPLTAIRASWFLKACLRGLISKDLLLKSIMEYTDPVNNLRAITQFVKGEGAARTNRMLMEPFFGAAFCREMEEKGGLYMLEHTEEGRLCRELYDALVPKMVDRELRRGDSETPFSRFMSGITYIEGVDCLVRILRALGTDTLDRNTYYYWYGMNSSKFYTKKEVLSSLLKSCYPLPGERGADLGARLKGTSIKESRLVETAMYAPQWIDLIEEYLGWKGLKSGCYYFMAHMDERFDHRKQAMIAKYTPLSPEELQFGAFDVNWFREAYGALGEKHFEQLYKAAKYICDGQKHSRARKYADAASGKAELKALEAEITAKRNKDLLMSCGLVPFGRDRERDMLERYQFIQQFGKESRQFGAQRRASEGKAVEMALTNLSVNAGFADVTRLNLNMEARMAEQFREYMEWRPVEDVEVKLEIGEDGKSSLCCRKEGRLLKSLPSRLGKEEYVLRLKGIHKKLKDQHSRTRRMMEEAMEGRTLFSAGEIGMLLGNPVAKAILEPLVFVRGESLGFVERAENPPGDHNARLMLAAWDGGRQELEPDHQLRIAHPLDFYRWQTWHEYQKLIFKRKIKQPFKQVFRELYVKLPEELYQKSSRMFAGNQIQPRKTVACLRDRRWVADYEEGLQKIYYKEDIIARIYALADWFSPGEAEEPVLEWVEFTNRRTFEALTIEQVPDIIYSEVMRDVDLAVSVAHAGGVDPETSHSTLEMRRAIVEFNLPLFGITNVTLKDSHAFIQGTRGAYTVHLGSGVIHQAGGTMLNILPVHSQSRGRLFLPFVDEDPKTAEIMSKIVLLAEDGKIKDPFILDQIG